MSTVTVTVLFTDLVGSTGLMARVGEEDADGLRREHFRLLREAITDTGGREVKNLGDGLMVAFDGAGAAVAAGVAMQQALSGRPTDAEPLSIRVGIAVGEVEAEDGDYFGVPVVEAARLCAAASGDQILVTDLVRLLTRSRGGFDLDPVGPLELKGLAEPVHAFRVRWEPVGPTAALAGEVPYSLAAAAVTNFIGRREERERLAAAMKAVEAGDRRAVLVSGEPGIGKTTLTSSFAVDAASAGAIVLYGRCDEDILQPYQPWAEAMGHLFDRAPHDLVSAHVDAFGVVLGRVVPALWRRSSAQGSGPEVDEEAGRHLLFPATVDLLTRAAELAPVVLVLDDLHWADRGTVQLLQHVLTTGGALRLLVIATFRDSDIGPDHPLTAALARLHREPTAERMALRGLGDDDVLDLLEVLAGHPLTAPGLALRDALMQETDGNPFFVGEMLRHLRDSGGVFQGEDGRWTTADAIADVGLPVSIREVVGRRVRWLGEEAHRVLTLAAVIGREFDLDVLEQVADHDGDQLLDLCDAAVDAAVLHATDRVDRYAFAHALIERTLYDELSPGRRARVHLEVAEALERLCGDDPGERVTSLAHHWSQATRPDDVEKAVDYARLAGDQAMAKLAPNDAIRWYSDALALVDGSDPSNPSGIELRVALGLASRAAGAPDARAMLTAAAHDAMHLADPTLLASAAIAAAGDMISSPGRVDQPLVDALRTALERLAPDDSPVRARLLIALATELVYEPDQTEGRRALTDALAMAERLDDPASNVFVLMRAEESWPEAWSLRDFLDRIGPATEQARALGDPRQLSRVHRAAASTALRLADTDRFDHHLREVTLAEAQKGGRSDLGVAIYLEAIRSVISGDPEVIDRAYQAATDSAVAAGRTSVVTPFGAAGALLSASIRGELGPLLPLIEAVMDDNPGLVVYRSAFAWALAWERQLDRCAGIVTAERRRGFDQVNDSARTFSAAFWTYAAHVVGDQASAAELVDVLERHLDELGFNGATFEPSIARFAGFARHTLGDLDQAVDHHERALAVHRDLAAPYWIALSEVDLADVLADRGGHDDLVRARNLARSAHLSATDRGYGYVERDAAALLGALAGRSEP